MEKGMTLAVLTPAYNRKNTLGKLYASLKAQTCPDFFWMIVDDGSRDGTEEMVRGWMKEKQVEIGFLKKENGGKHTALNAGISAVRQDLVFIVDSDDYLTEDAVETVLAYAEKYETQRETKRLCGFSFLRHDSQGKVNTAYFPKDEYIDNYVETRINGNIGGDKAEVFYTEALRQFPFQEYPGEKFMPEDAVWIAMSQKYDMVHINKGIYICDYLEGGLTRTGRAMKIHSPKGMMLRSRLFLNDRRVCLKAKVKMALLYGVYSRFAGIRFGEAAATLGRGCLWGHALFYLCYFPSIMIQGRWKKQLGA